MHWFFTQSSQNFVFGTLPSTRILWKDPAVLLEILATWRERSIWPKNFGFFKKKLTFRCHYHHWKNTSAFYKVKQTSSSNIWFEHSNVIAVFYSHCQCRAHTSRDRHHTSVHNVCCSSFQESMDPNMRSCEAIDSEFSQHQVRLSRQALCSTFEQPAQRYGLMSFQVRADNCSETNMYLCGSKFSSKNSFYRS